MGWIYICLLILLAVLVLWAAATGGRRNHPQLAYFRRFPYAHRGLHDRTRGVPENSMAAFRLARERGFGVELDVHLTRDGRLAVVHDKSLKRTAGVDVEVESLTVEELKQFRLEGTEETIPMLEEVAALFQDGPPLLVELKADYFDVRALVAQTVETLDRYRVRYCIESFHPGVLLWLLRHRPDICRGQLSQDFCRFPGELKPWQALCMTGLLPNLLTRPDFIAFHHRHCWVPAVFLCRRLHHLPVVCWTVDSQKEMERRQRRGYQVIFEGFVPKTRKQLKQAG